MFFCNKKLLAVFFFHKMAYAELSTRIVCISDTHSSYDFTLPHGDILLHAGDITRKGNCSELERFLSWLKTLTEFRLKIIIAGNHDVALDKTFYETNWQRFHTEKQDNGRIINMFNDPTLRNDYGIVYLQDETFIDSKTQLKFYGRLKYILF
jgi:predicted phosphodiesterase